MQSSTDVRGVLVITAALVLATSSCMPPAGAGRVRSDASKATDGEVHAAELTRIADEFFAGIVQLRHPFEATVIGMPGADHARTPANSREAIERWEEAEDRWLARLDAVDPRALARPEDRDLHPVLDEILRASHETRVCRSHLWNVNQLTGWQTLLPLVAAHQPVGTAQARSDALARYRALPGFLAQEIANLEEGVLQGYSAPRSNVERVLDQIDGLLSPSGMAALMSPASRDTSRAFQDELTRTVRREVAPALAGFRSYLADEYLSQARPTAALSALPNGRACYRALVRQFTTADRTPEQLHALGLRTMETLRQEMRDLASEHLQTDHVSDVLEMLGQDPAFTFRSREHVVEIATEAVHRARIAAPQWFTTVPAAEVVVEPYPESEEASAPDSYVPAAADGSRPAMYRINTANPTTRSRATAEATAFHETIPGHHMQLAVAQERPEAHPVTRFLGATSFVEGWALYAERLADEMGLYSGPIDRFGMLANQAFRAARLVVDPGIHVLGWSREDAIEYLVQHTTYNETEAALEVDRYVIFPGQATAYMVGNLELIRLRDEAKRVLGAKFDVRQFHDVILRHGAVTLPVLEDRVTQWLHSSNK
jgi:uncharacterized protein (DUF885 family)